MPDHVSDAVNKAFGEDTTLRTRILDAIAQTPQHTSLFHDISLYHIARSKAALANGTGDEHAAKRRKLPHGSVPVSSTEVALKHCVLEARDISFTLPQRKKYTLMICQDGLDSNNSSTTFSVSLISLASGETELEVPLSHFGHVLRLPVPEKAQKQYNYCLLPKDNAPEGTEPIIWTINESPGKTLVVANDVAVLSAVPDDHPTFDEYLAGILQKVNLILTTPTSAEFTSATRESHRKGEAAYHVKAHRGSKDGFLFFLSNGVFFGFKKPLLFLTFDSISSISYTSVLARTFNLTVSYRPTSDASEQEIEFSMLDQADFAGIDAYVKSHELQDASMAEARRAKKLKAAKGKEEVAEGEPGELEKAQQQIEDEEDEEDELEEDYDPGSEGDSEGSGESDEEEDDQPAKRSGTDLVKDELGSEAEDVEITDEEDGEEEFDEEEEEDEVKPETKRPIPHVQSLPHSKRKSENAPLADDEDQL